MNRQRGLTLVEMLVAIFILAVLSVLSYRTVAAMTDAERHLDETGRSFARLARALDTIERDLVFARDLPGELALRGEGGDTGRTGEIRFVRAGSNLAEAAETGLAVIGYRSQDGRLERLRYPDDTLLTTEPLAQVLLDAEVRELRFRFRDGAGAWRPTWPAEGTTGLPRAVEYRLVLADGAELTRVVALP